MTHTEHMNEQDFQFAMNGESTVNFGKPNKTITVWSKSEADKSINLPDGVEEWSATGLELFKEWCEDTNTYYYGAPHEDFDFAQAMIEAQQAGATYLYAEDFS